MTAGYNQSSETPRAPKRHFLWKLGRGALYVAGIITWGIAVGGAGRLCAFIISEIREQDWSNTAIVWDPATRSLRVALLLSPPLEGKDADDQRAEARATEAMREMRE